MSSEIKWNDGQLKAINSEGTTTLVSAAAGSGKTAVLVERIIRKITRSENPSNIEDFLIVTFTKAAASQMKDKISEALSKKIAEQPDNRHLKECKFKLPFANISTIDSFCIGLVRDNFNACGVSPDFAVLDTAKENILYKNAVNAVIEEFHNEHPEEFTILNEAVNDNKNDTATEKAIISLYKESRSHTFPDERLDGLLKYYEDEKPLDETETAKFVFSQTAELLSSYISAAEEMLEAIAFDETGVKDKYEPRLNNDIIILTGILEACRSGKWEAVTDAINSAVFDDNKGGRKNPDKVLSDYVKNTRNVYKRAVTESKLHYFMYSAEDYEESRVKILPVVRTLVAAVKRFGEYLAEYKQEENAYAFEDILHFVLDLLLKKENGKVVKTDIALELSSRYTEIFVDEYQDVNAAQDSIFDALSDNDKNRFLVGDVKQCIYTFRDAMPQVFISLRDEKPGISSVYLNNNYRSRSEITDIVNFIFRQLMSKETGDVDYNESEYLYPDAPYTPDGKTKIEFKIMEAGENEKECLRNQAYCIGKMILDAVKNGEKIVEKANRDSDDSLRDITLSDFCILYRRKNCGKIFGEVFDEMGIPYISDNEDSFLSCPEINFLKALLRVIDNPTDDVSLAAVMLSPVYGFTPDELAQMRVDSGRHCPFYRSVSVSANSGNKKAASFLSGMEKLRRIASTRSAGEFTADIIDEIGLRAIVSKMKHPSSRLANINSFITLADSYEETGEKGISAFVRFVSKLGDNDVKVASNASVSGTDCVKMMTIHKSKGLEFPVVIIPNTEHSFNQGYHDDNLVISKKYGIGLKYIEDNVRYKNLLWLICLDDNNRTEISEELRLLYVAMTRAKEKLVIFASEIYKNSIFKGLRGVTPGYGRFDPAVVSGLSSYAKILGCALLSHPDAHILRRKSETGYDFTEKCDARIDFNIIDDEELKDLLPASPDEETKEEKPGDEEISPVYDEIRKRLDYRYPFESLNRIRAKSTASNLAEKSFNKRYFASSKPQFAMNDKLTGAQIGTATHRFMQYCDLVRARNNIDEEMKRQVEAGILTQKEFESIDRDKVSGFFKTDICRRLIDSEKIYREFSFNATLPVTDLYPEIDASSAADEVILIEGVVDCAFIEDGKLVIIDFKTDKVSDEAELVSEYRAQLDTYRKCLSKVLNTEVKETVIYSFHLGKTVTL